MVWSLAVDALGNLVAPRACAACDAPCAPRSIFCAPCAREVELVPSGAPPSGIDTLMAGARYGGAVAAALARFKYRSRPDLAVPLAHLALRGGAAYPTGATLVPVPLHPTRLVDRGYNQAALLARALAAQGRARVSTGCLRRVACNVPQAQLAGAARRANLTGVFLAVAAPAHVVLVDDVCTTGSTLRACAAALRRAGAARVDAWVVALADAPGGTPTT